MRGRPSPESVRNAKKVEARQLRKGYVPMEVAVEVANTTESAIRGWRRKKWVKDVHRLGGRLFFKRAELAAFAKTMNGG